MRRLVVLLCVLCFTVATAKVMRRGSLVQVAPTANLLTETFDVTGGANGGYDSAWTEVISGGTVEQDDTTNPPRTLTGFDTQQLKVNTTADFDLPTTSFTFSGAQANDVYCRAYVYVSAETLADGAIANIIKLDAGAESFGSGDGSASIGLRQTAGQLELILRVASATVVAADNISTGTGYRVEWRINDTSAVSELRIGGVTIDTSSGPDPGSSPTRIRLGIVGQATSPTTVFFDGVACGDNGWLGA